LSRRIHINEQRFPKITPILALKKYALYVWLLLLPFNPLFGQDSAQIVPNIEQNDSLTVDSLTISDSLQQTIDSLLALPDSLLSDSVKTIIRSQAIQTDTLNRIFADDALNSVINYKGRDSLIYNVKAGKIILYGQTDIQYEKINLKSDIVEYEWDKQQLLAKSVPDSTGFNVID
jgi:hypothetical protein